MLLNNKKTLPFIRIIENWQKSDDKYATGALIEVTNGKGLLYEVYGETPFASYLTLMFGSQKLFQFQGDEYFSPTCNKIMRSGYGLEQTQEFKQGILNKDKSQVSFLEAVNGIKPILGLLDTGYYVIIETKLYPTDGNGHLFCEVPDSGEYLPGTCICYYGNFIWGNNRPYFTVATQPQHKICQERINYYMENPCGMALAFYMDGYICLVRWTSQNTCISKITYIIHFVKAVKILEPGRIIELTNFFLSHSEYTYQRCMLVKELFTLEKTEKLINYLIDILVEYEDDSPEIKDLILGYL